MRNDIFHRNPGTDADEAKLQCLQHAAQYGKCVLIVLRSCQLGWTADSPSKQANVFHTTAAAAAWCVIWHLAAACPAPSRPDI